MYTPLAPHLTNVSHLIVCLDGQLSRLPFEMLLVSKPGGLPRYLVEEKTISYVGSGREVARLGRAVAVTEVQPLALSWVYGQRSIPANCARLPCRTSKVQNSLAPMTEAAATWRASRLRVPSVGV